MRALLAALCVKQRGAGQSIQPGSLSNTRLNSLKSCIFSFTPTSFFSQYNGMKVEEEMSQHLYTSISVSRYWQNAAKLTEQKVHCERGADVGSYC